MIKVLFQYTPLFVNNIEVKRVRQVLAKILNLLSGNQIEKATEIILREYEKNN